MSRAFGAALIVAAGVLAGYHFAVDRSFVNPYSKICDLVEKRIYLPQAETAEWSARCRERAALVGPFTKIPVIVRDARDLMASLQLSHLEIYHPREVARLWSGRNLATGIESEFVDGELVIFQVHAGSPAAEAGLRAGDLVLSVQGTPPAPVIVGSIGGPMRIRRGSREFEVELEPREIVIDERPSYLKVGDRSVVIKVPSFRAEFFEHARWEKFLAEVPRASQVIVDLRGNVGGNFVAGLRFLEPFMCAEQEIGFLIKPRVTMQNEAVLPDDLDDETQLSVLDHHELVRLRTKASSRCLTARVSILIDSQTASTAEMVTQALRDYLDARVLGVSSAGRLLVGVWHHFPELGKGWKISVPEAVYQSRRGKRLEGGGVRVDRELYYDLKELTAGQDSWILRAILDFRREPAQDSTSPSSRKSISK